MGLCSWAPASTPALAHSEHGLQLPDCIVLPPSPLYFLLGRFMSDSVSASPRKVKGGRRLWAAWEAVRSCLLVFCHKKAAGLQQISDVQLPRYRVCTGLAFLNRERGLSGTCTGGHALSWSLQSACLWSCPTSFPGCGRG